tara:strand:- start:2230 stop:3627 length:1398 start_codon:yes stop_codon:yes gene_type:complete
MAITYVDYTATAAQTDFAFSFPYLEDRHVVVEIDGVTKTLTTHYTITTSPSTKVVLTSGATAGQKVRVRRISEPDVNLVDFVNGSVLTESDLDRAYLHNRYVNEEMSELNDLSFQKAVGDATIWDALSLRIANLAEPTGTADAPTKNYVDTQISNTITGSSTESAKYTFTGDGATTQFAFSPAITLDGDTMYEVAIDGVLQTPTTAYAIDADNDRITFTSAPPASAAIVVVQRGYSVPVSTGSITTSQIPDDAVTTAKIADDAITTALIADDAVTTAKIADDGIATALIADDAVTTAKIADDAITAAKIADNAVGTGALDAKGTAGTYYYPRVITTDVNGRVTNIATGGNVVSNTLPTVAMAGTVSGATTPAGAESSSFNVASFVDGGVGIYTWNTIEDINVMSPLVVTTSHHDYASPKYNVAAIAFANSATQVTVRTVETSVGASDASAGDLVDPERVSIVAFD